MTATETSNFTEVMGLPGFVGVRLTTTATTDTYVCPYFNEIMAVVGNNESDNDGVGVGVNSKTITLTVDTAGDVITLLIAGR